MPARTRDPGWPGPSDRRDRFPAGPSGRDSPIPDVTRSTELGELTRRRFSADRRHRVADSLHDRTGPDVTALNEKRRRLARAHADGVFGDVEYGVGASTHAADARSTHAAGGGREAAAAGVAGTTAAGALVVILPLHALTSFA